MSRCVCTSADEQVGGREAGTPDTPPAHESPRREPSGRATRTRRALAYHEAAHAVFAILAGGQIETATIVAGDDYAGIVRWSHPRNRFGTLESAVLAIMAGPAVESLVSQRLDPTETPVRWAMDDSFLTIIEAMHTQRPSRCCTADDCQALHRLLGRRDHASAASLRLDYVRAGETTLHILKNPAVWRSIEAVAARLLRRKTCGAAELEGLIAPELRTMSLHALARGYVARLAPLLASPIPECPPIAAT